MAQENDLVLIHMEDTPIIFARIENIEPDIKPDWYHVKLLMLQIPPAPVTWILRSAYIDGAEFTMGGKRMRLELVICPDSKDDDMKNKTEEKDNSAKNGTGKVISLANLKKR